jgi:hypothetical protein
MKTPLLFGLFALIIIAACQPQISSFEECAAAGNPIMESYPRQCRADGQTFVEKIEKPQQTAEYHECTEAEKQAEACTLDYNPVCGVVDNNIRCITAPCPSTNAKTFGNGCGACSAKSYGYYTGACEGREFVVCGETVTGFDPVEYAENSNGICVDVCPGNYDPFVTQIGVELCIRHYGIEEIEAWDICRKSSEDCRCAKAYETTRGDQIGDPEYRCVPDRYAERLLFRGGLDSLDKDGEQSVAIA